MEFVIILLIVLVIMVLAWVFLRRKATEPEASLPSLDDVQPGGVIVVQGTEYLVEQKNRYTEADGEWFELKLTGDEGQTFWIDWYGGNELNVTLTRETDFDALDLTSEDLVLFDDEETGELNFDDVVYHFSASGESQFYENSEIEGESFYYWNFEDEEHENVINVQRWSGNTYDASIGRYVKESDVEIYSTSEA